MFLLCPYRDITSKKQSQLLSSEDRHSAREAEESSFLEAVTRKRLANTQQAGKKLSGCCAD
jgi:hypothetical protein